MFLWKIYRGNPESSVSGALPIVKILSVGTNRSEQTVQTQITLHL